jgi:hypothetical protein
MTTESNSPLACGATFIKDDGSQGICTLLQGHPSGHTDIPTPPGGDE